MTETTVSKSIRAPSESRRTTSGPLFTTPTTLASVAKRATIHKEILSYGDRFTDFAIRRFYRRSTIQVEFLRETRKFPYLASEVRDLRKNEAPRPTTATIARKTKAHR